MGADMQLQHPHAAGIVPASFPYGVEVWHTFSLARYCADRSKVGGKPCSRTVLSRLAMPDFLTKDSLPSDISAKLLSLPELLCFFCNGADMMGVGGTREMIVPR